MAVAYIVHDDNEVCILEVVQLVRDEDAGGVAQVAVDALVEELPTHVRVDRGQGVIEQIDFSLKNLPV